MTDPQPLGSVITSAAQTAIDKATSQPRPPKPCDEPRKRDLPSGVIRNPDRSRVPKIFFRMLNQAVKEKRWPMYVWGSTGTGKTTALAIAFSQVPLTVDAMFIQFTKFCELVTRCRKDGEATEWIGDQCVTHTEGHLWYRIKCCQFLFIDEIGVRSDLDTRVEILQRILDERVGKPTLMTGNVPFLSLEAQFDSRVSSRISGGYVLEMTGQDRRLEHFEERVAKVVVK